VRALARKRQNNGEAPQRATASRLVSTILLDEWFELEVRPRLKGRYTLIRFADDAVMEFEEFLDAKRVLGVLGKCPV
jgi:RNA-directed DNA polymerase